MLTFRGWFEASKINPSFITHLTIIIIFSDTIITLFDTSIDGRITPSYQGRIGPSGITHFSTYRTRIWHGCTQVSLLPCNHTEHQKRRFRDPPTKTPYLRCAMLNENSMFSLFGSVKLIPSRIARSFYPPIVLRKRYVYKSVILMIFTRTNPCACSHELFSTVCGPFGSAYFKG